ncbi:glycosyltransferase family 2 protein [Butyrivibrio sp. AC2005]|uniref:glycosyltransferase family 2 protein n=1 Tax=Butyrivibrio sp. AC2005 TaxID=1280672 RepID=UPI0004010941|nr:glycosyltransferase family 2 protein [Butyrivibrio sp. AC2005]
MNNKVTIIIPNYNGAKFLDDCLKSLKKQSISSEVIIIDNGSTDNGIETLRNNLGKHAERYPKTVIHELSENTGFANAVNVGIRLAKTEYVILLNNDTVSDERMTENLLKAIDGKSKVFSVGAKMLQMKEPHNIDDCGDLYCALGWAFSPGRDKSNKNYDRKMKITSACAGAAIYRKDILVQIGGFDEAHFCYLEDVDVGYRARIYGYQNYYEPTAVVYHAGSGTSGSRYNVFKEELTAGNNLYLIYKNMPFLQILLNLPFVIPGILIKQIYFIKKGLGIAYFNGLVGGVKKIIKNSDRKVEFKKRHMKNYVILELELLVNCVRRLVG